MGSLEDYDRVMSPVRRRYEVPGGFKYCPYFEGQGT